jgi:hypothetical protein
VAPTGANAQQVQQASDLIKSKIGKLAFETRPAIQAADIKPAWKLVVFLASPDNLKDLVAAAPATQFIAISEVDVDKAANLSVVRVRPENQAFAAGYVSVLISDDWRAGGLLTNDTPAGAKLEEAFKNGGHYLCGVCNSVYGPATRFPVSAALPSTSAATAWQAAFDGLMKSVLYVVYVTPEAANPQLLTYLISQKVVLIGGQTPPPEGQSRWGATVRLDTLAPLGDLIAAALKGKGGTVVNAPVQILDVQAQFFTPGRQQLAQKMLADLKDGWIDPLSVPAQ